MTMLSMNEMTTYRWSLDEDIQHYQAAQIPAIGVWRRKLADFGEEKGIELIAESGLKVSNLLWAGGFTGSDGHSFRESVEDASEAIRIASDLSADCLVVYTGSRAGHTHNHARRLTADALRELAPVAEQHDVTLALEPMHPGCASEWTFLTTVDDTLALIDAVGSTRVKLAFDTYHSGNSYPLEKLKQIASQIAIVHLGDAKRNPEGEQDRCRLGEGIIPLREIVRTLRSAGYQGYYDVELLGAEIEASDYVDLLTHSKRAFEVASQ